MSQQLFQAFKLEISDRFVQGTVVSRGKKRLASQVRVLFIEDFDVFNYLGQLFVLPDQLAHFLEFLTFQHLICHLILF